jgi:Protein of unknown function (DUF3558)
VKARRSLLVVAGVLSAACSKSSSGTGPASSSASSAPGASGSASASASEGKFAHPCSILRRADAEAILGTHDLHEEEQPGPPGDARCAWSTSAGLGMVELRVHFPSRKDIFDRRVQDRTPVPGIGDKAYVEKRQTWGHVDVLKGDQTFFVQIERSKVNTGTDDDPDKVRADTIALARTLAPRI